MSNNAINLDREKRRALVVHIFTIGWQTLGLFKVFSRFEANFFGFALLC